MDTLPPLFLERLQEILPHGQFDSCLKTFAQERRLTARINTLKTTPVEIFSLLKSLSVDFERVSWYEDALILKNISSTELTKTDLVKKGLLYIQSLSSMLPPLALTLKPDEHILDACAAPGSKTTQMAALMGNQGSIIAADNVKDRYYKLRSVVSLLGAEIIEPKMIDARRLRSQGRLFDKILVDAPCSSEGRFKIEEPKTYAYWSPRKIKEMVQKQRGLLLSASRLLKHGGTLVYSTCTFAPEENEGVVDWFLRKAENHFDVAPIQIEGIKTYPALNHWQNKKFDSRVSRCLRVFPDGVMEGFFMVKFIKETLSVLKK